MPQPIVPFCPNTRCAKHAKPTAGFCRPCGSYHPKCRAVPIRRFRCRSCRKSFSTQTFRHDYRDRRPECNVRMMEMLSSSSSLRQIARVLGMGVSATQHKFRKIARTCALLEQNVQVRFAGQRIFVLDEEETYEQASIRTLTVAIAVEHKSWFVVGCEVGTTRRLAKRGSRRRRRQDLEELQFGRRPDESKSCVRRLMEQINQQTGKGPLVLRTDLKGSYATLAQQIYGDRVTHETISGKAARTTSNPLFAINSTIATSRDSASRLRRRSWTVTKRRAQLVQHLAIFRVYRNYVRQRFNRDRTRLSPASCLGLMRRALTFAEVLAWRQDFGRRSVHPMEALRGRSWEEVQAATGAA